MAATKKKPSPAQLAARKRFAEMARSGAFKRKRASGGRAKRVVSTKARKAPSPAQLRARAKFVATVRARAKGKKVAAKKNASGVVRFKSEKEYGDWLSKTKGASGPKRKAASVFSAAPKKRGKRFKKTGVFGGSGFLGLGRSRKKISARNPKRGKVRQTHPAVVGKATKGRKESFYRRESKREVRQRRISHAHEKDLYGTLGARNPNGHHLPGLPAKYQRMYEDILASSGSKRIAAATTEKAVKRANPSLFVRLFSRTKKRKVAAVGYRKTQVGRRKVAAVGYRKTQRGQYRPTAHTEAMGRKRTRSRLINSSRGQRRLGRIFSSQQKKVAKGGGLGSLFKAEKRYKRKVSEGTSRRKSRSIFNPSPASVFSEFRGKDATTKTKVKAASGTPKVLAKLGSLQELHLRGKKLHFGNGASLAADGKKRLHIVGTKFAAPNPPGEVDYGEILSVTYRSDKPHIETGIIDYVHKFESPRPCLVVDEEGYGIIEGGGYDITDAGIEG